ncbi:MAG: protein translocase subunit SecF [Candidatus Aminicenantes bacterium]|nr:protein translocase subunit SecF [Candidatus Aminicenantes bacterium]
MRIIKKTNIDFMQYKYIALAISGIIILTGIINMTAGKGINYGIDFAGGTLIRVIFKNQVPIGEVRTALQDAGIENPIIQKIGDTEREFIIRTLQEVAAEQEIKGMEANEIIGQLVVDSLRTEEELKAIEQKVPDLNNINQQHLTELLQPEYPEKAPEIAESIVNLRKSSQLKGIIQDYAQLEELEEVSPEVISFLKNKTFLSNVSILSRETVGPQIGRDLRRKATQATIWALIGMLIYIGIRFQYAYGVAAILTLAHDVLITVGIFSLTNRELNLPVIAAILTIVGYSLNDTIVIFDRVRDNIKLFRKLNFGKLLNTSVNQTLSRTIITSGTTFLTVTALFLFGGQVINDFAFTMMIGVIIGTYSSIYLSCSVIYFWKVLFKPKKGMGK